MMHSEIQLMCDRDIEWDRESQSFTIFCGMLSFLSIPFCSPRTDQAGSPEISSISSPRSLLSLAFTPISASLQQTLGSSVTTPLHFPACFSLVSKFPTSLALLLFHQQCLPFSLLSGALSKSTVLYTCTVLSLCVFVFLSD